MNEVMIREMLRFFYHELSQEEEANYEHFLKDNPYLMQIYHSYIKSLDNLSTVQCAPSQTSLDRIMLYAQEGHLSTT